jgi:hypothetical protein
MLGANFCTSMRLLSSRKREKIRAWYRYRRMQRFSCRYPMGTRPSRNPKRLPRRLLFPCSGCVESTPCLREAIFFPQPRQPWARRAVPLLSLGFVPSASAATGLGVSGDTVLNKERLQYGFSPPECIPRLAPVWGRTGSPAACSINKSPLRLCAVREERASKLRRRLNPHSGRKGVGACSGRSS